jgi:AraC-like DNA-binding protein
VLSANDQQITFIPFFDVGRKENYTYLVNEDKSTGDVIYVNYDDGEFQTSLYSFCFDRDTNVSLNLGKQSLGLFFILDEELTCEIPGLRKGTLLKDHFNLLFSETLYAEFRMKAHRKYTFFGIRMTLSFLTSLDSFSELSRFLDNVRNRRPALLNESGFYVTNEAKEFVVEVANELHRGVQCKKMHIRTQIHRLIEASLGQVEYANDKESILFDRIKLHINDNLATVTVVSIEDKMKMSPLYLRTLVKKKVNMKPVEYIIQCRMQKSLSLLSKDYTLFEIARQVGYSDQSAFSKAFLKCFGKWPTQVRNERKEMGGQLAYFQG